MSSSGTTTRVIGSDAEPDCSSFHLGASASSTRDAYLIQTVEPLLEWSCRADSSYWMRFGDLDGPGASPLTGDVAFSLQRIEMANGGGLTGESEERSDLSRRRRVAALLYMPANQVKALGLAFGKHAGT